MVTTLAKKKCLDLIRDNTDLNQLNQRSQVRKWKMKHVKTLVELCPPCDPTNLRGVIPDLYQKNVYLHCIWRKNLSMRILFNKFFSLLEPGPGLSKP